MGINTGYRQAPVSHGDVHPKDRSAAAMLQKFTGDGERSAAVLCDTPGHFSTSSRPSPKLEQPAAGRCGCTRARPGGLCSGTKRSLRGRGRRRCRTPPSAGRSRQRCAAATGSAAPGSPAGAALRDAGGRSTEPQRIKLSRFFKFFLEMGNVWIPYGPAGGRSSDARGELRLNELRLGSCSEQIFTKQTC